MSNSRKETGRGKRHWKVRDLLADERCSRVVLNFLATTDVGRRVPAPAEEDVQSEASEWELRERRKREEERRAEARRRGRGTVVPPHARLYGICGRGVRMCVSFIVISLVRLLSPWDRPWRRAKGSLQRAIARTAAGKRSKMYAAIV
jgi:hypothetical protein